MAPDNRLHKFFQASIGPYQLIFAALVRGKEEMRLTKVADQEAGLANLSNRAVSYFKCPLYRIDTTSC